MPKLHTLNHEFVEFLPDELEPGVLYISVQYKTMAHLCCCGCGKKVVTPISPTGWEFAFDGRAVSVSPSVGNWNLDCRSHYVIRRGRVQWARQWSKEEIAAGFARDRQAKEDYYHPPASREPPPRPPSVPDRLGEGRRLVTKLRQWWSRKSG
jgi:Family of unknown function (DUF6527)